MIVIFLLVIGINFICGDPVYYTPLVDICDFPAARTKSLATPLDTFTDQIHGGYFTVNKKLDMNLFSVFVKSAKNWTTAPLIIWIQGQPGCSALYGFFGQHGPYYVDENFTLIKRPYSWTNEYNVLYLDNMVFTGYSYSHHTSHVMVLLDDIGHYLYDALYQFYQIFPELGNNDLYLAGEMFSGKYLLLLGYTIHQRNPLSHIKMPLKGLYIGSGFTDPITMMEYSALLYQIGMIDFDTMNDMEIIEEVIRKGIRSRRYSTAQVQLQTIWIQIQNAGYTIPMDFTTPNGSYQYHIFDYLQSTKFRNIFKLGEKPYHRPDKQLMIELDSNNPVSLNTLLEEDILRSVKKLLPDLLQHYRVLYYGGQFDLIVPFVHIANFLRKLAWPGAEEYYNKERNPRQNWFVDNELAGYWKTTRNLTDVMVRNSAQMIDASQPKWAYNLLKRFINNGFHPKQKQPEMKVNRHY